MKAHFQVVLAGALSLGVAASSFAAGNWERETIAGMTVNLYVPNSQPTKINNKRALMITMGGCGQQDSNSTEFRDQSNWESTAEEYGMVIAQPQAPGGGVLWAGCWDYYDANHSRTTRHDKNLLELTATLKARSSLNIDADQVYISGLSSGAGIAIIQGCLAPEIYAGVGNNAGPAVGTSSSQTTSVGTTVDRAVADCKKLAGSHSDHFQTQLMSIVWGSSDYLAAPAYAQLNADVAAKLYGASSNGDSNHIPAAQGSLDGVENTWSDASGTVRVSKIMIQGMSHAWPAGGKSGASQYMEANTINYPAHLTAFLFDNNLRVERDADAPLVAITNQVNDSAATVSGNVSDSNGYIVSANIVVSSSGTEISNESLALDNAGDFSFALSALADGAYSACVTALDNEGKTTKGCTSFDIGETTTGGGVNCSNPPWQELLPGGACYQGADVGGSTGGSTGGSGWTGGWELPSFNLPSWNDWF